MGLPFGGKIKLVGSKGTDARRELVALAAVLVVAVLSWQMIGGVATALYRQYEDLGDPPLVRIVAAGPELGETEAPQQHVSQLGHTGYFWSERAFHYRLALMFAVDDYQDPEILSHDTWQQHPDGVNAWREYTVFMEPVYGFLYRLAGDQARPLVEFLLRLIPLVHVLIFFPLYLMARALGCRRLFAVLGVVFYATCTMGFVRMTGSLLLKEDFALLCLSFFLTAHLWAWKNRSFRLLFWAALLLIPVLASWHLSQFLVLIIFLGAALAWGMGETEGEPSFRRIPFFVMMPCVYLAAGVLAGLTPTLWTRGFLLSLPMAVLGAWTLTAVVVHRHQGKVSSSAVGRLAFLVCMMGAFCALVFLNRAYAGDYNHVFGLFVQKFVHGFQLPADPALLPFDARVFWGPPFNTPSVGEIWTKLGYHTALLLPVLGWGAVMMLRPATGRLQRSFLLTVPVFLGAYLMIERLGIVFLLFAAVAVAMVGDRLAKRLTPGMGSRALPLVVGLLVITPVLNLNGNLGDMIRIARSTRQGHEVKLGASDQALWQAWQGMFSWVRVNTPGSGSSLTGPPAVFLGEIGVSPQLLLYTGRPIVLNSQFENAEIRHRYQEFLEALYSPDETVMWEFARRHEADYIFINRNFATATGHGSSAYLAGVAGPLDLDMNVVKMHFRPESLQGFVPVYDNVHYRVLRVLPKIGAASPEPWRREFNSWWRLENFTTKDGKLADLTGDRARLGTFDADLSTLQDRQQAILAAVEKRWIASRGAGARRPDLMLLHRQFVQARLQAWTSADNSGSDAGRLENAISSRLSEIDPLSGKPLGTVLSSLALAEGGWVELLTTHAGEPLQHATCGQLLALAGRYEQAVAQFEKAAAFFPATGDRGPGVRTSETQIRLWQEVVWWQLAAGRISQARDRAQWYGSQVGSGTREGEFFRNVAALSAVVE